MPEAAKNQPPSAVGATSIGALLNEAFELMTRLAETDPDTKRRKHRLGISTGFLNVDKLIGDLWPGELTVVTGRPGVGKTAFASNLAVNASLLGARVLFVALGLSATETVLRMCAARSRIPISRMLRGDIRDEDWRSITDAANRLSKTDLLICDDPLLTPEGLCDLARTATRDEGKSLVVIDEIELMSLPDDDCISDRQRPMDNIAIALKRLAREIDAPILTTMSYAPGKSRRKADSYERVLEMLPPGVENAADSVLHIDRYLPESDFGDTPSQYIAEVMLAKHRLHAPARTKLAYDPGRLLFMDYADCPREGR